MIGPHLPRGDAVLGGGSDLAAYTSRSGALAAKGRRGTGLVNLPGSRFTIDKLKTDKALRSTVAMVNLAAESPGRRHKRGTSAPVPQARGAPGTGERFTTTLTAVTYI